ncbi:hypothetical protein GCM10010440_69970 [Kitasatospora cinereorecta]
MTRTPVRRPTAGDPVPGGGRSGPAVPAFGHVCPSVRLVLHDGVARSCRLDDPGSCPFSGSADTTASAYEPRVHLAYLLARQGHGPAWIARFADLPPAAAFHVQGCRDPARLLTRRPVTPRPRTPIDGFTEVSYPWPLSAACAAPAHSPSPSPGRFAASPEARPCMPSPHRRRPDRRAGCRSDRRNLVRDRSARDWRRVGREKTGEGRKT